MKGQVSPVVAVVIILIAALGIGYFVWSKAAGPSFSKDDASRLEFKAPSGSSGGK